MNALLNRTRISLALGISVLAVAAGGLASAPTAKACAIDVDQTTCVGTKTQAPLQIVTTTAKQKHVTQHHRTPLRHSR